MAPIKPNVEKQTHSASEAEHVEASFESEYQSSSRHSESQNVLAQIVQWFRTTFPGHENTVMFGLLGALAAVIFLLFDLYHTIIFVVFIVIGVAIGQKFDGKPTIIRFIKRLFRRF